MALILKNGIFYHIPKTGGVWVGTVLKYMGLVDLEYREKNRPVGELNLTEEHISPLHANKEFVGDKPSFAFIRNPVTWYQSIWKYKINNEWGDVYAKYQDEDFNAFMKNIMDMSPGFLTRIYKEFEGVTYLGKQENLRDDLASVLETLKEEVDYDTLINTQPVNTSSDSREQPCDYDPKTLKRVKKLEKWIFKKYYPEGI